MHRGLPIAAHNQGKIFRCNPIEGIHIIKAVACPNIYHIVKRDAFIAGTPSQGQ